MSIHAANLKLRDELFMAKKTIQRVQKVLTEFPDAKRTLSVKALIEQIQEVLDGEQG